MTQRGFSLLELLCTSLLVSLLFLLSFPALRLTIQTILQLSHRETARTRLAAAEEELLAGFRRSRALYGYGLPQVLKESDLRRRRIRAAGDGILFSHVQTELPLFVTEWSGLSAESIQIELCTPPEADRKQLSSLTRVRRWVTVTVDSLAEVEGRVSMRSDTSAVCAGGSLLSGNFRPGTPAANILPALVVLPLVDRYAVYVDEKNSLRRRSFLSGENQPVSLGVKPLRIEKLVDSGIAVYEVQLSVESTGTSPKETRFSFALPEIFSDAPPSLI